MNIMRNGMKTMKSPSTLLRALLLLALAATAMSRAAAQDRDRHELTTTQKLMLEEAGSAAIDFWNPRLNDYKRSIDRILTPGDLEKLNAMRVKWSIAIATLSRKIAEANRGEGRVDVEIDEEVFEEKEEVMEMTMEEGLELLQIAQLWMGATAMAKKYREELVDLGATVRGDVGVFTEEISVTLDRIADAHADALAKEEGGAEILAHRDEMLGKLRDAGASITATPEKFTKLYTMTAEPLILLFNGGDLRELLPLIGKQTSNAEVSTLGAFLPASAVLQQNYPNPAEGKTTIPYTLSEASAATTLRLYDADGKLTAETDLGAKPAGAHTHDLDLGGLAPGTYLYQLSIETANGQMLFSKVMQVVR